MLYCGLAPCALLQSCFLCPAAVSVSGDAVQHCGQSCLRHGTRVTTVGVALSTSLNGHGPCHCGSVGWALNGLSSETH